MGLIDAPRALFDFADSRLRFCLLPPSLRFLSAREEMRHSLSLAALSSIFIID